MRELSQPPLSARSSSSSGECKQTRNDVTAAAKATARSIDKSMCAGNQVTGRGGPSQVTDMSVATDTQTVNQHDLDTFHKEYGFKLSLQLDEAQHYEILEMLLRYKCVFARDMTEINVCKGEPLKLELHTNRKMFKRQYRLSEPDKVEMDRQIQQMEKSGVIERSSSSY